MRFARCSRALLGRARPFSFPGSRPLCTPLHQGDPVETMKIAVVGAGAMGSVYAGLLADAGNEVWAVDVWQEHVDAINAKGLRVEGVSGDRVVQSVRATTDPIEVGECDLVIIATKAAGVGPAVKHIKNTLIGSATTILTIQNGLGAGERICQHLSSDQVLVCVAGGFGASMKGPGHVFHNGMSEIRVGEMQGGLSERVEKIAAVWRAGGFTTNAFEDINKLIWEKFIVNVTYSAPCTVFNRNVREMMADPHSWHIAIKCAQEAYEAARAKNIDLSFDDPEKYVTDFGLRCRRRSPPSCKITLHEDPPRLMRSTAWYRSSRQKWEPTRAIMRW